MSRELLEAAALVDDDEIPGLPVAGGGGAAAGLEDAVEVLRGERAVGELTDVSTRGECIPCVGHW